MTDASAEAGGLVGGCAAAEAGTVISPPEHAAHSFVHGLVVGRPADGAALHDQMDAATLGDCAAEGRGAARGAEGAAVECESAAEGGGAAGGAKEECKAAPPGSWVGHELMHVTETQCAALDLRTTLGGMADMCSAGETSLGLLSPTPWAYG